MNYITSYIVCIFDNVVSYHTVRCMDWMLTLLLSDSSLRWSIKHWPYLFKMLFITLFECLKRGDVEVLLQKIQGRWGNSRSEASCQRDTQRGLGRIIGWNCFYGVFCFNRMKQSNSINRTITWLRQRLCPTTIWMPRSEPLNQIQWKGREIPAETPAETNCLDKSYKSQFSLDIDISN